MIIYAIVNGLINAGSVGSHNSCVRRVGQESGLSESIWTLISPSGILQGGNPYFVPDFAERFEARTATAVRIGKLGKGVAPRFAHRYVEAVAPAVVFIAADKLQHLMTEGLPWTSAISYDRCLALGRFSTKDFEDIKSSRFSLTLETEDNAKTSTESHWEVGLGIEETIAAVSRDNTIKTGDIILFGLSATGPEVSPGMKARLLLNGESSISFNIR